MKIAWMSSWAPRPCGIATYSAELVGVLRKKGNQVDIICHPDGGSPGERYVHPVMDTRKPGWDEAVYEVVKKIRPDVVHIQHEYGLYQTNGYNGVSLLRPIFRWDSIAERLDESTVLVLAGEARQGDPAQLDYKKKLLSLVEGSRFKDRIRVMLGSFEPSEYERILASFDVMVMPYSYASQSGSLANSFSLGVPVVASAMEGLKAEIEESGAGLVVPPDDGEELEQAIAMLISNDSLREKYSKRAKEYVKKRIGWSITVDKHLGLYKKLIKAKKAPMKDHHARVLLEA